MDNDTPRGRAALLGMLKVERVMDVDAIPPRSVTAARFAPGPVERARGAPRWTSRSLAEAPARPSPANYPEMARWISGAGILAMTRVAEATAMASRAPLDLRVNTLKAKRDKIVGSIRGISAPKPTPWSPIGLRIRNSALDARANPGIHAEEDFIKGRDRRCRMRGSQLAALLSAAAKPGEQVDRPSALAAGGKTLALAAAIDAGQGPADRDRPTTKRQLAARSTSGLSRARPSTNCDVRTPKGGERHAERHPCFPPIWC